MNFNELVKVVIEPVLTLFDFKLSWETDGIVEYESEDLTVSISYDYSSSYEASMSLMFNRNKMFYSCAELKKYFYKQHFDQATIQTKDKDLLMGWLVSVRLFFEENLRNIVSNLEYFSMELEKLRQAEADNYERDRVGGFLKEDVENYWSNKDYAGLVQFLKNYDGELDDVIKKKYNYALRMVNEYDGK